MAVWSPHTPECDERIPICDWCAEPFGETVCGPRWESIYVPSGVKAWAKRGDRITPRGIVRGLIVVCDPCLRNGDDS